MKEEMNDKMTSVMIHQSTKDQLKVIMDELKLKSYPEVIRFLILIHKRTAHLPLNINNLN